MKNLINFFFSFDKLLKEKLIIPFFWLSLIVFGLAFFADALSAVRLGPLAGVVKFINWFASLLWALIAIRLIAEIAVAIFRINDNLSPDGGKSELADIDPVFEARKAAELAASRARDAAKTATEKTKSTYADVRDSAGNMTKSKTSKDVIGDTSASEKPAPVKIIEPSAADAKPAARRGRPAGSKNKTKAATTKTKTATKARAKKSATKTTATKAKSTPTKSSGKRGPKKGTKVPRDAQGRLLKKDGTPRAKPGPKKS